MLLVLLMLLMPLLLLFPLLPLLLFIFNSWLWSWWCCCLQHSMASGFGPPSTVRMETNPDRIVLSLVFNGKVGFCFSFFLSQDYPWFLWD